MANGSGSTANGKRFWTRRAPKAITARIVAGLERMILANPGQWLWVYRRWKRWPLGDDPARFPFYAVVDRSVADHPQ